MPITQQQIWAQKAFKCVQSRKGQAYEDKYLTYAKQLPSLIHTCGAVQALAFAHAKGSKDTEVGVRHVLDDLNVVYARHERPEQLLEASLSEDLMAYIKLNRELILVASWIKRYAEALLKGDN